MTRTLERRAFPLRDVQIRAAGDDRLHFRGRAVVYGQLSDDLGGWRERIDAAAATRTLGSNPDTRFLINHNPDLLLGRTTSGTLKLLEVDEEGLDVDADMADVSYARDLAVLLERGDITQMSFAFWVTADSWAGNIHQVHEFDIDGGDVSVVTFPAYPQTSAELRAKAQQVLEQEAAASTQDTGYPLERAQHRLRELELLQQA